MLDLVIEGNNRTYQHRTLRVNYTSYDLQRCSDVINIRTRPDLMVLSEGDYTHPYQYGRLIDIFTVSVHYKGSRPVPGARRQKLHVLWVRWYERNTHFYEDGFSTLRLPQLSFVNAASPKAHGFINPTTVLRAAHLIPAFHHGTMNPQPLPDCHATRFLAHDWNYYYANM